MNFDGVEQVPVFDEALPNMTHDSKHNTAVAIDLQARVNLHEM